MRYTVEVTKDSTSWYKEGTFSRHMEDGPAIEYANGDKEWYKEGKRHREDGPACEFANGTKRWYLENELLSEEEFNEKMNPSPTCEGKVVEIDGKKYKLSLV